MVGEGRLVHKSFKTTLEKFLKQSGNSAQYPTLPEIAVTQVSKKVVTAEARGRISTLRSTKEEKKKSAEVRDTSNY